MSILSDFVDNTLNALIPDEAAVIKPVADNYLTTIINSSSLANDAAQSTLFIAALQAQLPNMATTAIHDVATQLKATLDAAAPALVAQAQAALKTTAAPV